MVTRLTDDQWFIPLRYQKGQLDPLGAIRRRAGVSQVELAERLGVSESAISTWECGVRKPGRRFAAEYERVVEEMRRAPHKQRPGRAK